MTLPAVDINELNNIVLKIDQVDVQDYIVVHYYFKPFAGFSLQDTAVRVAIMTSLKTLVPVNYETQESRIRYCAKVFDVNNDSGEVVIGYPIELCSASEGLPQLLMLMFTGCEYSYADKFWVSKIELPKEFLNRYSGPGFGIDGIRDIFGVQDRPLIGAVVKPRNGIPLNTVCENLRESLLGGVDFIVDDVLLVDPQSQLSFNNRVPVLAELARELTSLTGEKKSYIANISSSPSRAREFAEIAKAEGASALIVNTFTMGYSAVQEISENAILPIITTNFGIGMLTHPTIPQNITDRPNGVSEEVMALLARLAGTDAAHVGTSGTDCAAKDAWGPAVMALRSRLGKIRSCFSVAEGDLTIADVWSNIYSLGADFMLETCTGIFNYPGGPRKGASAFRTLVENLHYTMDPREAHDKIIQIARSNQTLRDGLEYYKYSP